MGLRSDIPDDVLQRLRAPLAELERLGAGRPLHVSLTDYLDQLAETGLVSREVAATYAAVYHEVRFGGNSINRGQVEQIARALEAAAQRLAEQTSAERQSLARLLNRQRESFLPTLPRATKPPTHAGDELEAVPRVAVALGGIPPVVTPTDHSALQQNRRSWLSSGTRKNLLAAGFILWSLVILILGLYVRPQAERWWRKSRQNLGQFGSRTQSSDTFIQRLRQEASQRPGDVQLWGRLAFLYFQQREYAESIAAYRHALSRSPDQPELLNNLAWLLCTADDEYYRDPVEALALAERAYKFRPTAYITDTLAEAAYLNGDFARAVALEESALAMHPPDQPTYEAQLRKFQAAAGRTTAAAD